MPSDSVRKIPLPVILLVIAALVVSAVVSFYLGRMDGERQTQPPVVEATAPGAVPRQNGLVKLPPQRFENWTLACVQNAAKATRCSLVLEAISKANKKPILSMAITRNLRGRAVMVVITPPGALLSAGVHLTPGTGKEVVAQFVKCGSGACEAVAAFDDAVAAEFTAAAATEVKFVTGNGRTASIKIPNGGFGAAYPAWLAAMPAPPGAPTPAPAATKPTPTRGPSTPGTQPRGSESTPAP